MIEVDGFCKEYRSPFSSKKAQGFSIKDLSFKLEAGSITGLIGPNGSGKTTIIKAVCGFHYPGKGKILISSNKGEVYNLLEHNEKAMEICGYVPEISRLPPDMKVIDFLYYAAKAHKLDMKTAEKRIEKLSKELFMSEFIDKRIKILSKGQQQRVSFAQALIHNPDNLILDEPFSGLDPAQIIKFRNYIKDLGKTKSILISTHILSEVSTLCDKAYIMFKGRLHEVLNLKKIEEEFIKITGEEE